MRGMSSTQFQLPSNQKPVAWLKISRLPFFLGECHFWYRDEGNNLSKCRAAFQADEQSWRAQYWKTFSAGSLYKISEWAHEEEHRLVLHSNLFDLREKPKRTLRYRFEDLAGIVFGARTDLEDKLAIIRIIDNKCSMTGANRF
jgi:hypothetical protein